MCSKYFWSYGVSGSRSEYANSGSPINDLVSGIMKGKKKHTKIVITCTIKYSIIITTIHRRLIGPVFLSYVYFKFSTSYLKLIGKR